MARSSDLVRQNHTADYILEDNMCGTMIKKINAPFNIIGLPVLIDYNVIFSHEENYISWNYGGNRAKDQPKYADFDNVASQQIMPSFDWEKSSTPKLDAVIVALLLYIVIAAIPITAGTYYVWTSGGSD